jgi:hypothetical protein
LAVLTILTLVLLNINLLTQKKGVLTMKELGPSGNKHPTQPKPSVPEKTAKTVSSADIREKEDDDEDKEDDDEDEDIGYCLACGGTHGFECPYGGNRETG